MSGSKVQTSSTRISADVTRISNELSSKKIVTSFNFLRIINNKKKERKKRTEEKKPFYFHGEEKIYQNHPPCKLDGFFSVA